MSDRQVAAKLLIKRGDAVWVSDRGRAGLFGPLPDGVAIVDGPRLEQAHAQVAVVFADDAATTRSAFDAQAKALLGVPVVWILYPKGNRTDVNRDSLWRMIAPYGMRPITNVAVDNTWSALRFRPTRPDEAPFTGS